MIILDGPGLMCRAHLANPDLSWNGMPTGALRTGLTMLAALPRVFARQQLVVEWVGRNSWRKQILPEYKAGRVANEEDRRVRGGVFRQIQVALDIIETIGVAHVYHDQAAG